MNALTEVIAHTLAAHANWGLRRDSARCSGCREAITEGDGSIGARRKGQREHQAEQVVAALGIEQVGCIEDLEWALRKEFIDQNAGVYRVRALDSDPA